jgi:uncharacterized protein
MNSAADTRLLEAARTGDADGVRAALDAGAKVEARDGESRTPLLLAPTPRTAGRTAPGW